MSRFPNGKITVGTGALFKTVSRANCGRFVLTNASNLFDNTNGGKVVEVVFQHIPVNEQDAEYDAVPALDWYYPDDFPEHSIPTDLDRRLVQPSLARLNDRFNYGLIKLSEKIDLRKFPEIAESTDSKYKGMKISLSGLFGFNNNEFNGKVISCLVSGSTEQEISYYTGSKIYSDGTVVVNSDNEIIAIHSRYGAFGDQRCYGLLITPSIYEQIIDWQF